MRHDKTPVLPTVARVFEKLIFDQLSQYFTENGLLGNEQYGFRSLYSTALALGEVTLVIKDAEITMYADDTSLLKAFTTINQLQEELIPAFAKVCEWLKNNKRSLNSVKTECMILGTS